MDIKQALMRMAVDDGTVNALNTAENWHGVLENIAECTTGSEQRAAIALDQAVADTIKFLWATHRSSC